MAVLPGNISGQNKKYAESRFKYVANKKIIFQIYIVRISVIYWKYIRPNTFLAGSGEKEYLYNWFIRRNIF